MNLLHKLLVLASASFFIASAQAQNAGTVTNHAFAIGKGAGTTGYTSLLCGSAQLAVGQSAADPICKTITGDWTLSAAGAATLATVNSNVGSFGSVTSCPTFTVNAKGLITAASAATCTPAIGSVTGLGTGVATFLATPSSANLRAALTDEVGTGAAYFVGGALGTPASATLTNATGLPLSGLNAQAAFTFVGNNTSGSAVPTAVDIATLTAKASPAATDLVMVSDQAASGAWKRVTVSSLASAGSVASIAGNTGAFTLSGLLTNSVNDLRVTAVTKSDQTTATSNVLAVTPLHQQDHPSAVKAWLNATTASPPVLNASYNISGCVKNSTGNFTCTFSTAFASASSFFCTPAFISASGTFASAVTSQTSTTVTFIFLTSAGGASDPLTSIALSCVGTQ